MITVRSLLRHFPCNHFLPFTSLVMAAINAAGEVARPLPVSDTLFFKIQGDEAAIGAAARAVQDTVARHGSTRFEFAQTDEEAAQLWESRKYALMSTIGSEPGSRCWTTDVCVPPSRLPQLVHETKRDLAENGLRSTIVGHVGDGGSSGVDYEIVGR